MDPVSIASLAGTAAKVCFSLYELVNNIKDADSKLHDLSKEVNRFTELLQSVEKVVKQCQPHTLTLAHLDDHIWQQIANTMADCQLNLTGLGDLVNRIGTKYDAKAKNVVKVLSKSTLYMYTEFYGDDIAQYVDKIYKSNCAMQTTLVVVNVSLSFRTNISQDSLLQELEELKGLIRKSLEAASGDGVAADSPVSRQNTNLEGLAKAAQKFYSSASSTASTIYGGGDRKSSASFWGGSVVGLSDLERERIEQWNDLADLATVNESEEDTMTETTVLSSHGDTVFSGHGDTSTTVTSPDAEIIPPNAEKESESYKEEEDEDSDDSDEELDLSQTFEKLALASFVAHDYSKAEQCLCKVLERQTNDAPPENRKKLRLQLALAFCLQEKWDPAAEIITSLPKTATAANLPVFDLLQAVSIALLQGNRLQDASRTCKAVLKGKKKITGRNSDDYFECLSLFAAICEKKGDSLEAEAVRHLIPAEWKSRNSDTVQSPKLFILTHASLAGLISYPRFESQPPGDEESHPQSPSVETPSLSVLPGSSMSDSDLTKFLIERTSSHGASPGVGTSDNHSAADTSITRVPSNEPLPTSPSDSPPLLSSYLGTVKPPGSPIRLSNPNQGQIRWNVRKDIGNIGGQRPLGGSRALQFLLPLKPVNTKGACYISLKEGWQCIDQIASLQGSNGVTMHESIASATAIDKATFAENCVGTMKHFRHKMIRRKTPLKYADIDNTSQLRWPRNWLQTLRTEIGGESVKWFSYDTDMAFMWAFMIPRFELEIAELIAQIEGTKRSETITSLRLDGIVYTLPDLTYRLDWMILTKTMAKFPLMQHARVIPHSLATLQYYYDSGALMPSELDKEEPSMAVVVLNCDRIIVECVPYLMRLTRRDSQDRLEIMESESSFMAEVTGLDHVTRACIKMACNKLGLGDVVAGLTKPLSETLLNPWLNEVLKILPRFERNGKAWAFNFDLAPFTNDKLPGQKDNMRRVVFSNAELLECFATSVALVRKMLEETVVKLRPRKVSHVIVAGPYTESKYLLNELQLAVDALRLVNGGPMNFLHSPDGDNICALGALSHGISR